MSEEEFRLREVEMRLGHSFENVELLRDALVHSSYRNENEYIQNDNERLEFLGDSVVGLVIAHLLCDQFPDASEGTLTRYKAQLVSEVGLSGIADDLELGHFLLLGRGEDRSGGRRKVSILANTVESLIGAVYLDSGYDAAKRVVTRLWKDAISDIGKKKRAFDYKTHAQELTQERFRVVPEYAIIGEEGPDHDKWFLATMKVDGNFVAQGKGRSKKDAHQDAARVYLESIAAEVSSTEEIPARSN